MSPEQPNKRKRGRPINQETRELSETFDYSPRHVRRALKELGADRIKDLGQLKLLERQVTIAFRHLRGLREEHDLKVARRSVVPKDEVLRLGMRIGELTQAALNDLVQRGPAELAGHDELKICDWLKRATAECVLSLRSEVLRLDKT